MTFGSGRRAAVQGGFTLLEVMIAMLVLAFGLLGFALLQTMSVRMSQSSNYRTNATNLASELLDQIRANRAAASSYAGAASFAAGSRAAKPCIPGVTDTQSVANASELWKCQVVRALGDSAGATVSYQDGVVGVILEWGERAGPEATTRFEVQTRL
ncbi:type IV pilus modification protein PilV [Xanthomonas sp. Kuri4-1]